MVKLYANKATHQIGVKAPRNLRFDKSVGAIAGSYYDEKNEMWILNESDIDEVEYHLERIFGYSRPAKPEAKPAQKPEPAKVIQIPDKKEEEKPSEPAPESTTEKPAKVIQMNQEKEKAEKPATDQQTKDKDAGKNWLNKLMDEYNKAKKDGKMDLVKIITAVGTAARKDPELQAMIEQAHKTIARMNDYILKKAYDVIQKQASVTTSKGRGGYIDDAIVYEWAIAYFFEDDKAKVEAEEKKKAEDKAKSAKEKKEREEKEKRRKAREAKKAEKEAKAKEKAEAEAPKEEKPADQENVSEPDPTDPAEPDTAETDVVELDETDPIDETIPSEEPDEPLDDQLSLL